MLMGRHFTDVWRSVRERTKHILHFAIEVRCELLARDGHGAASRKRTCVPVPRVGRQASCRAPCDASARLGEINCSAGSDRCSCRQKARPSATIIETFQLVISIGNQEFGMPRKYQYQIGSWYLIFISQIYWYFLGILSESVSTTLLKVGLILVFFGRIKIGLVFGFWWLPFHWYRFGFGLSFSWKWHL